MAYRSVGEGRVGNGIRQRKHILLPVEPPFYSSVNVVVGLQDLQSPVEIVCVNLDMFSLNTLLDD